MTEPEWNDAVDIVIAEQRAEIERLTRELARLSPPSAPAQERTVTLSLPCECASLDPDERPCMACDILATAFDQDVPQAPAQDGAERCRGCSGSGITGDFDDVTCTLCNGTGKARR